MKKLSSLAGFSPFWFASFWSVILFAGFFSVIPQPATYIGYVWKTEFALAALILLTITLALKFSANKISLRPFGKSEFYFVVLPLISFTLLSGFSCIWARAQRNALHHTLLWACYVLLYLLIREICVKRRLLDVSLKATGTTAAILGALCLIEYFTTAPEMSGAVSLRYSKYAEALAVLLPVFFAAAIDKNKRRSSILFGAFAAIAWLGVVFSLGRTEFAAGAAGLLFLGAAIVFFGRQKISVKKAVTLTGVFVLLTVASQISLGGGAEEGAPQTTLARFSSGTAENQTSFRIRFLLWNIALQSFERNPLFGVGADNFVVDYKNAREDFSQAQPDNSQLSFYENLLPERAHNEFVQILSELGAAGAIIFAWLLFGVGKLAVSMRRKSASSVTPVTLGALAGMFAFLVSSLASSYSFRVTANGACFFFLLALFVNGAAKAEKERENSPEKKQFDFKFLGAKVSFASIGLLVCAAMLIFSTVRGASLMYLQNGLSEPDNAQAEANFQLAITLDGQDGLFRYCRATQLYNLNRDDEAAPQMRLAIENGVATSVAYFYLAAAHIGARQTGEADTTLRESLRVYPRSVFLRTFYADFLRSNGRAAEAQTEFDKAAAFDNEQAQGWRVVFAHGTKRLNQMHGDNQEGGGSRQPVEVMNLQPNDAIYAVLDFQRQNNPELLRR